MSTVPTIDQIIALKNHAKEYKIKPLRVKSAKDAKRMTYKDRYRTGKQWRKGDRFFWMSYMMELSAIPAD